MLLKNNFITNNTDRKIKYKEEAFTWSPHRPQPAQWQKWLPEQPPHSGWWSADGLKQEETTEEMLKEENIHSCVSLWLYQQVCWVLMDHNGDCWQQKMKWETGVSGEFPKISVLNRTLQALPTWEILICMFSRPYSQVHKYQDINTILIFLAQYFTRCKPLVSLTNRKARLEFSKQHLKKPGSKPDTKKNFVECDDWLSAVCINFSSHKSQMQTFK